MDIDLILEKVNGKMVTSNKNTALNLQYAMASDLMSDVLTLDAEHTILITGLANLQTIRTAEMSDIHLVLLVRNKKASPEMINLANQSGISLIESPYSMFRVSGILYNQGIKPLF